MILLKPSYKIETGVFGQEALEILEAAGRTCYLSAPKEKPEKFIKMIIGAS